MTAADLNQPIIARLESEILFLKRQLEEARQETEGHCARADEAERLRDRMTEQVSEYRSLLAAYDNAPGGDAVRRSSPAPPELQELSADVERELEKAIAEHERVANAPPKKGR